MMDSSANASATSPEGFIAPLCSVFRRFLKSKGLKFTPERAAVLDVVTSFDGVFEADNLQEGLKASGLAVGMATVYRTLRHLVDAGILSEVLIDAKQNHYRLSYGQPPVGYLVCIESGQVIEFPAPELLAIRDRICRENGLTALSSRLVVYASTGKQTSPPPREVDPASTPRRKKSTSTTTTSRSGRKS
ncbi:MAG: transcriptional repressor [Phycisphaeraceae bacterium]|nr:transcriptional repressor [Phycisphaeraceae bacterium]